MNRLTDNDHTWGPFTLARWAKNFAIEFSTGDREEESRNRNQLLFIAFGWALRITLPNLVPCASEKVFPGWDEATVKRLGRNYYFNTWNRRFGIWLSDMGNGYDYLQVKYGRSTYDSSTDKHWGRHLPWKQWKHIRHSVYTPNGVHFYTEPERKHRQHRDWQKDFEIRDKCPTICFGFEDFDGEMIVATCRVEEREWHRGEGWFTWLKWFYRPKIHRSLDLKFNKETGPEKGSWKGGTIGTGCEMLPGDTPEMAFRRFCDMEHSRKGRKYKFRFIGPCEPIEKVA